MTVKTVFKRGLAIILATVLCLTACFVSAFMASAEDSTPINLVYSDDFSENSLSDKWVLMGKGETIDGYIYTSSVADGKLKVDTQNQDRSRFAGALYLPGKETCDQRVAVEFNMTDLPQGNTVSVYARLTKKDDSNWKSFAGYYARYSTSDGRVLLYRADTASKQTAVTDTNLQYNTCGSRAYESGCSYRLEMTVTGQQYAVINVRLIKITASAQAVVVNNTFVDKTPFTSGTAGVGVGGKSGISQYACVDNFSYTSTDNYSGGERYLSHLRSVSSKTFGQTVALEPNVEYVFGAVGTVDSFYGSSYANEPLWVEYHSGSTYSDNVWSRIYDNRKYIQKTCDLTKAQCVEANLPYSEYNFSYVTFTAGNNPVSSQSGSTGVAYVDSTIEGKVRHIVGIRLTTDAVLLGNYSYFTLYRKDDPYRTNLLVNPDFKMGLYGWTDAPNYYGFANTDENSKLTSSQGYVSLLQDKNNYEYYDTFKNPAYEGLANDANRDKKFNICDIVYTAKSTDYYFLVDSNKNGLFDGEDTAVLRVALLDTIEETLDILGLDNDSVDDDKFN